MLLNRQGDTNRWDSSGNEKIHQPVSDDDLPVAADDPYRVTAVVILFNTHHLYNSLSAKTINRGS